MNKEIEDLSFFTGLIAHYVNSQGAVAGPDDVPIRAANVDQTPRNVGQASGLTLLVNVEKDE